MTIGLPDWVNPKLAYKRAKASGVGKRVGDSWYFTYPAEIKGEEITRFLWAFKVCSKELRVFAEKSEVEACAILHDIEMKEATGQDPRKSARPFRKIRRF